MTFMDNPCMTLLEATKALHLDVSTLMMWIQRGDCPFGTYVKKDGKVRGHYIIVRKRFEKYMSADDMVQCPLFREKNPALAEQLNQQYEDDRIHYAEYEREKEDTKDKATSDKYRLREYCENLRLYYTSQDLIGILAPCPDLYEYFRKGVIKAVNPDGHKWFIEKEAFNSLDPEVFPEKCRKRYLRHLKNISKRK